MITTHQSLIIEYDSNKGIHSHPHGRQTVPFQM